MLGNHDGGKWVGTSGYSDTRLVRELLANARIELLHNRSTEVMIQGRRLNLTGVGDLWAGELDATKAFADTRQDADFLREIAGRTGGRYSGPEAVAALAEALPRQPLRVVMQSETELWNTTPLFILFVAVLGCEWLLRKRYGLL